MGLASLSARCATLAVAVLVGLPVAASAQPAATVTGVAQPATPAAPGFETLALLTLPLADFEVPADIAAKVRLADGVLWLPPSTRWLLAPRLHDDVLVRLQFKPSADAAVGVLIRGFLDERRARVQRGYELWLPPRRNGKGRFVVVHMGETRNLDFDERPDSSGAPWADAWHSLVVEARQDRIDVVLDDTRVFLGEAAAPLSGVIGLRVTGGPVEWREAFLQTRTEAAGFPGVPTAGQDGVPVPKLRREVKPRYTKGALSRRVEGEVWLDCIVGQDGTVTDARIASSLDPELDEQALIAARQWRFEPARRDGKPIAVVVTISIGFRLER